MYFIFKEYGEIEEVVIPPKTEVNKFSGSTMFKITKSWPLD